MFEITKEIQWDMGHRVAKHRNKCAHPHGHRYQLQLTIRGELHTESSDPSEGMVHDFCDVKSIMLRRVHDPLDHGFMICEDDHAMVEAFAGQDFKVIVVPFVPTAENIACWCYQQLKDCLPARVQIARCRVYETPHSWADFYP